MANKKIVLIVLMFLFLLALPTFSAQMGIGVEPTIVSVYLSDSNRLTYVPFKLSNPSATIDDIYTLEIDSNLRSYIHSECDMPEYWCAGKQIFVPINTPRQNGTILKVLFEKKTSEAADFTSYMIFSANPQTSGGMVALKPEIQVKVIIHQTASASSSPSGSASVQSSNPTNVLQPSLPIPYINRTAFVGNQAVSNQTVSNQTISNQTEEINMPKATAEKPAENSIVLFFAAIGVISLLGGAYYYFKDRVIFILPILLMLMFIPMLSFADVSVSVTVCPALINITNQTACVDCSHYWYGGACNASPAPTPTAMVTASAVAVSLVIPLFLVGLILWMFKKIYDMEGNIEDKFKLFIYIIVTVVIVVFLLISIMGAV